MIFPIPSMEILKLSPKLTLPLYDSSSLQNNSLWHVIWELVLVSKYHKPSCNFDCEISYMRIFIDSSSIAISSRTSFKSLLVRFALSSTSFLSLSSSDLYIHLNSILYLGNCSIEPLIYRTSIPLLFHSPSKTPSICLCHSLSLSFLSF